MGKQSPVKNSRQLKRSISDITLLTLPVLLLPLAIILAGCNNSGCTDNHSALPLMGFYDYATAKSVTLDSIDFGGVDAPADSLLAHSGQKVSQLYLPFRNGASQTSFYIHYNYKEQGLDRPEFNDTVTFIYDTEPYFASSECGAMYRYRIRHTRHTRHLVDSLAITDSLITNIERERIQLFFRTADPGEGEVE